MPIAISEISGLQPFTVQTWHRHTNDCSSTTNPKCAICIEYADLNEPIARHVLHLDCMALHSRIGEYDFITAEANLTSIDNSK